MDKKSKGLRNPAALVAASAITPAVSSASEKGMDFLGKNAKPIVLTLGAVALLYFGPKWYKKWRAEKYANENIGNPNLIAASIIYNSFSRFELPGFLGFLIPSFDISTDEQALNELASRPGINIKTVAHAYKILFDRNLALDIQEGLSTQELRTWYNLLQAKGYNDSNTLYPIGTDLYVAKREGITVNKAIKKEGEYVGTNELFKKAAFNEKIGEVVAHGVYNQENYYIVRDCVFLGLGCDEGVVLQHQIIDTKL